MNPGSAERAVRVSKALDVYLFFILFLYPVSKVLDAPPVLKKFH